MTRPAALSPAHSRQESGFAIVAILVMVGVISMIATTYSRHVIVSERASNVSEAAFEANEIIDSQIDFALQSQQSGQAVDHAKLIAAVHTGSIGQRQHALKEGQLPKRDMEFGFGALRTTRVSMEAKVLSSDNTGVTRLIEVGRESHGSGDDPDSLPQIDEDVLETMLSDLSAPRYSVLADTTLENMDVTGILVVKAGVTLTLRDVVLEGSIVSDNAIKGWDIGSFKERSAPTVIIDGSVRIRSGSHLDGVAVLMPDGVFETANSDARLTLQGDVVAHSVTLAGSGSTSGRVASAEAAVISDDMQQIGDGRGSDAWSDSIDTQDSFETTFLAFVPRKVQIEELTDIAAYTFPKRASRDDYAGGEDSPLDDETEDIDDGRTK